jgi:putative ABC transport system substrate-binding protein
VRFIVFALAVALSLFTKSPGLEAQPSAKVPRVGLLSTFSTPALVSWHHALRQGLHELGWVEGRNIAFEYRSADGRRDRLPDLAADLVRLKVDVIVTSVDSDTSAARDATRVIPIVMVTPADPVAFGLVDTLARPGGNITGLSQMLPELIVKRLELLKEMIPGLSRVGVIWSPGERASRLSWNEIQRSAPGFGVQIHSLEARSLQDFDRSFEDASRARVGAIIITPDVLYTTNAKRLANLAIHHRLPSIYHVREFTDAGGLSAYGPDRVDMYRRAATYVDRILKGAKPADLPVAQPTKFDLVLNLRTARALGITIPPSLLLRADQVIE